MNKFMIIIMFFPLMVFSQTTIPYPTGMKTYREDLPDYPPKTNIYVIANSNWEPNISGTQNIGDFDGDGSEEIYSKWSIPADYHWTNNGIDSVYGTSIHGYNVYSLKTQSIILFEIGYEKSYPPRVETGDFNADGCIDYVIAGKIYTTSTPIKKKIQ